MDSAHERPDFYDDVAELQMESLTVIALFATAIGSAWITLLISPVVFESAPVSAWIGGCLLILSGVLSRRLKDRCLPVAVHVLVWGILGATACAVDAFPFPAVLHLFILPVIFASLLLGQRAFFPVPIAAATLALTMGLAQVEMLYRSADLLIPVVIILLVALASRLSTHNLYTALEWVWHGYERARHNEQTARERQAQLTRALKALDEATHRLERTNYMVTLARDQAVEARLLKQQFAQTISHELRTPLSLIVGFTELMAHSPEYYGARLPSAYLRDLSIVHRNACHLQTLVNDVLDLARIEAAQMSLVPEESDPAILALEAVRTVRSLVEARGLALLTQIEPGLPNLWVDPTRIRQVLLNLLNNAARFTERGCVTVSVCHQDEEVIFAVADTGAGIAPEDIPNIFEEFRQVDKSTQRPQGGAGLGLAISQRFVELHGGRIWVDSQVGQGSTFYFALPVPRRDLAEISTVYSAEAKTRPMSAKGSEVPVLLAVTRSPSAAALLKRHVDGCRTVVVPDLEQARATAQQLIPHAVVIDRTCETPDPSELEGLGHAWGLPQLPIVLCPLAVEEPVRQRLAVDGYLIKPLSPQSLWDVLRRFGEDVDKVLVVDDDQDFVLLLSRILENSPVRHYRVISAGSGREGLAMMRHYQPDLVLLDLVMPDIDGFEFVERARSNPEWQHIPIVVISAQDGTGNLEPLTGLISIAKVGGFVPGEVVKWLQCVMSESVMSLSTSAAPPGHPLP